MFWEADDADSVVEGETVTLMDLGNVVVCKVERDAGLVRTITVKVCVWDLCFTPRAVAGVSHLRIYGGRA